MKDVKCPHCGHNVFLEIQKCTRECVFASFEDGRKKYYDQKLVSVDEIVFYQCAGCSRELETSLFE